MNEKPLAVIGAGGNARVVVDLLRATGRPATVVVAGEMVADGTTLDGVPVIGGDDAFMARYTTNDVELVNGLGGIGDNRLRRKVFERYATGGFSFASIVHPMAMVADNVTLGVGAVVMAGGVIQPGTDIGPNVLINGGAIVEHGCRVGAHAHVATGAILCGDVTVGENAHIGAGATVLQGVHVGARAIVGAGAVVTRDLPDDVTATGVPARIKETRR